MPKFNKPTPSKINKIWATDAVSGDVVEIDTAKIEQGWIQEKPPYESENWINQQHDQYIAYINQQGIPEWDQYTEYQAGKSYVQGSNNLIYKCIQTHLNKNPATAGNGSFWDVWEGNRPATTTLRGTTQFATDSQARNAALDTVALTPSNLLGGIFGNGLLSPNGYITIPVNVNGSKQDFYLQWVRTTSYRQGEILVPAAWPIAFPNFLASANAIHVGTSPEPNLIIDSATTNNMQVGVRHKDGLAQVDTYVIGLGY